MQSILLILENNSNALIAISSILTVVITGLIWTVSRKQTEFMRIIGKAAEEPIIEITRYTDTLPNYTRLNNNFGGFGAVLGKETDEILVIQLKNTGKGSAHNLKIEQEGREMMELGRLPVGQKYEYWITTEEMRENNVKVTVKVEYQDIFDTPFTITG